MTTITTDIIKFFQAFIRHMAKVGGKNLPKTISTSLGGELGKGYVKRQAGVTDWKPALTGMIEAMGGKLEISEKQDAWVFVAKYPSEFCPIGGKQDTERFNITTDSVCIPYITGFLKALDVKLTQIPVITNCIVRDGSNACGFQIEFTK